MRNSQVFWRATRQSNLADRMEDSFIGRNAVLQLCEYENQTLEAFVPGTICMQSLIVQLPLPELFIFSYCAWLWNCLRVWAISYPEPSNFLQRMFDENEGSGKDQFLGDPDWLSEMQ